MNRPLLKFAFGAIIAGIALYACESEFDEGITPEDSLTVEDAKAWFETTHEEFQVLKSAEMNNRTKVIKPKWKGAFASGNRQCAVVETHITSNEGFGFATAQGIELWQSTGKDAYLNSLSRIVIMKDKRSKKTESFMMTLIGDNSYLEKKDFKLWKNNYLHRDKDFSGLVMYHTLNGEFVNGWKYVDGVVTHIISSPGEHTGNLKSGNHDCTTYTVYGWYQDCSTSSWVASWSSGEVYGSYTECGSPYQVYEGSYQMCTYNYTDNGDGGGYNPEANPQTLPPKLKSIANNVNLSQNEIGLLEHVLDDINWHCLGSALLNSLGNANVGINFKIGYTDGNPASYDPGTNTITFRDISAINSNNLEEELFHAWQNAYYPGGTSQYVHTGKVNIEFEAKLFTDLVNTGCCNAFNMGSTAPQNVKEDYQDWVFDVRDKRVQITPQNYQYWLNLYNQYTPAYNSPLSPQLGTPEALFSITSSSNC